MKLPCMSMRASSELSTQVFIHTYIRYQVGMSCELPPSGTVTAGMLSTVEVQ